MKMLSKTVGRKDEPASESSIWGTIIGELCRAKIQGFWAGESGTNDPGFRS